MAERRRYIQIAGLLAGFSDAVLPESWASLPMCHCKDDNVEIVRTKDDVEGKSTKDRPAEVSVETLKSVGRNGDDVNQAIQLIQKSNCGTKASSAYQAAASSASCSAAGWKRTDLCISRSIAYGVDGGPGPKRSFEQHQNQVPEHAG